MSDMTFLDDNGIRARIAEMQAELTRRKEYRRLANIERANDATPFDPSEIGGMMRTLHEAGNLSAREVGRRAGLATSTISHIETG